MIEFEINGASYRAQQMDAMKQFHVVRRLAPLMGEFAGLKSAEPEKAFEAIASAVSKMSDADADYVIGTCLDSVERQAGNQWGKIRVSGRLMYADLPLPDMLQIVWQVLQGNLGSFFPALLANSPDTLAKG